MSGASSPWRSAPSWRAPWSCSACCRCSRATRLVQPVDNRYKAILVWGGLRGAVTIVLAMVAAGDQRLPDDSARVHRDLRRAVRAVHPVRECHDARPGHACARARQAEPPRAGAARPRAGAVAGQRRAPPAADHAASTTRGSKASTSIRRRPATPRSRRVPDDLALDLDERVKVGLLTLCTREKELYLELFEQQILSRRMVARAGGARRPADRRGARPRRRGLRGVAEPRFRRARPRFPARPSGCSAASASSGC